MKSFLLRFFFTITVIILSVSNIFAQKQYEQFIDLSFGIAGQAAAIDVNYTGGCMFSDRLFLGGGLGIGVSGEPEYGTVGYEKLYASINLYISERETTPFLGCSFGGLFQNTITRQSQILLFYVTPYVSPIFGISNSKGFSLAFSLDVSGKLLNYMAISYSGYETAQKRCYLHPAIRLGYRF